MLVFRSFAWFMLLLSLVVAEDVFNSECSDQLNTFLTCMVSSGVTEGTFTSVLQEECQGCIESKSAETDSCEEVVGVVTSAIESCAEECAIEGCTTEVKAMFTCLSVINSDCSTTTASPTPAPSVATDASSSAGFGAFMAVIQEVVPLVIAVLGSSGGGRRLLRA